MNGEETLNVSNRISMIIVRNLTKYLKDISQRKRSEKRHELRQAVKFEYIRHPRGFFRTLHIFWNMRSDIQRLSSRSFYITCIVLQVSQTKKTGTYRMIAANVSESPRLISRSLIEVRTLLLSLSPFDRFYTSLFNTRHKHGIETGQNKKQSKITITNREQFLHRHLRICSFFHLCLLNDCATYTDVPTRVCTHSRRQVGKRMILFTKRPYNDLCQRASSITAELTP